MLTSASPCLLEHFSLSESSYTNTTNASDYLNKKITIKFREANNKTKKVIIKKKKKKIKQCSTLLKQIPHHLVFIT